MQGCQSPSRRSNCEGKGWSKGRGTSGDVDDLMDGKDYHSFGTEMKEAIDSFQAIIQCKNVAIFQLAWTHYVGKIIVCGVKTSVGDGNLVFPCHVSLTQINTSNILNNDMPNAPIHATLHKLLFFRLMVHAFLHQLSHPLPKSTYKVKGVTQN